MSRVELVRKIVGIIEATEKRLLRWMRLISVVVISLALLVGVWTMFSGTIKLGSSTDVSVESAPQVSFSDPGVKNEKPEPKEEPESKPFEVAEETEEDFFADETDAVVGHLKPLSEAVTNYSVQQIKTYVEGVIVGIGQSIMSKMDGVASNDQMRDQMTEAMQGLISYAEDFADYYGNEIELDTSGAVAKVGKPLEPAFKSHLDRVFQQPLEGYETNFSLLLDGAIARAEREAAEGVASIQEGQAQLASLPITGMVILALLLLLLLFRIEINLREKQ